MTPAEEHFRPDSEVTEIMGKPVGPPKRTTLLIRNISQLVTLQGASPRKGADMNNLAIIESAGLAISGDSVLAIGPSDEIEGQVDLAPGCHLIDAGGGVVTPGFVDSHTHPVFNMTREKEFEMRLQGKSYMEIADSGGGIRASVRDLRATDEKTLRLRLSGRLDRMLAHGTTTVEAKSGYGLSTASELMSLEVIKYLNERHPLEIIPTFLGAHEVPDEHRSNRAEYIKILVNEMIPQVAEKNLANFCDIFCEKGVFTIAESREILKAAAKHGLKLKLHADEFDSSGGAELACELGAVSADHLVSVSSNGISALAKSNTIATLLPGTTYSLGLKNFAPARDLIDKGAILALATDCNPGSNYCESMPMIISLACVHYRLTPAEAICATTVNAAAALGLAGERGQINIGGAADLVVWNAHDYREIPYHYGVNLVREVIKSGKVVVEQNKKA